MTGNEDDHDYHDMNDDNVLSMLVATDNHLGYMEKDPIRKTDSIDTFEEILKIAREKKVDFILLGGDLFHDNKPSRWTLYKTMQLFRQYCMGDKPCEFDFLSDQATNFHDSFSTVNYQDPNYNVSIPVFSIHGNHDDPSGEQNLAALDLLSVAGLVNYFGKATTADDITIYPLLMRKGDTKLALFGLGNVRDERLYRTIVRSKMQFMRPEAMADEWFNLFVLHQNRVRHTATSHVPETFIDKFIHFVVWGHEHECIPVVQTNGEQNFEIAQPGSSIATSLSEGEAKPKHVGILRINGLNFHWEAVRLKTVRPFVMDEVELKTSGIKPDGDKEKIEDEMAAFLVEKVDEMIERAREDWDELYEGDEYKPKQFPQPLIRLKVEYSGGYATYPPQRFGSRYVGKVANAKEILQFYRKKTTYDPSKERRKAGGTIINEVPDLPERMDDTKVEDLVAEYLEAQQLDLLPENELGDAVKEFVEKDDKDAIKDFVKDSLKKIKLDMEANQPTFDDDDDEENLRNVVTDLKKQYEEEYKAKGGKDKRAGKAKAKPKKKNASSMDEDEDEAEESETSVKAKGKGKAAAPRKTAKASTPRKPASKKKSVVDSDDEDEDVMEIDSDEPKPKAKAKAPVKAPAKAKAAEPTSTAGKRKLPGSVTGTQSKAKASSSAGGKKQSTLQFSQAGKSQASEVVNLDSD